MNRMARLPIVVEASVFAGSYLLIVIFMLNSSLFGFNNSVSKDPSNVTQVYSWLLWCKTPLVLQSPPGDPVALVSFPGSGNTWLRYLLQQVTGIQTGSVYFDYGLSKNGFPGETITDGTVLVVKTHEYQSEYNKMFKSAILLIRIPNHAILAEYNRLEVGDKSVAPRSHFIISTTGSEIKPTKGWNDYVFEKMYQWENLYEMWLKNFSGPIHVVLYENLVNNTENSLSGILQFLKYKYDKLTMSCALLLKEGIYRRHRKLDFDPFTKDMISNLTAASNRVNALIIQYIKK